MGKVKREKTVAKKEIFAGRLLKLRDETVVFPDGQQTKREIVEHPGAVAVIALTDDNELVLVRQFRKAINAVLLEIPAGVPKKGEKGEVCARRELEEETGYYAKKVKKIWSAAASPGYSTEIINYYLAQDLTKLKQRTDEDEFIEVDLVDLEECVDLLKNGRIVDNKTLIGIHIAELVDRGEL